MKTRLPHSRIAGITPLLTTLVAAAAVSTAHAAVIIQDGGNSSSENWNTAADWDNNATPISGNDYKTASGLALRAGPSSNGAASTFGGGSLEVVEGSGMLLKNWNTTSTINGAFTLSGGHLYYGPNTSASIPFTSTFDVTSFTVSGNSDISLAGPETSSLAITADLTGSGALFFANSIAGQQADVISFTGINSFTGSITLGADGSASLWNGLWTEDITLSLGTSSYTFQDTMTINDSSILQVNTGQTLTFNFGDLVDANNGIVAAGTYSTGDLGANYTGAGSIVVVPEVSTLSLLGLAGLSLVFRRRRA